MMNTSTRHAYNDLSSYRSVHRTTAATPTKTPIRSTTTTPVAAARVAAVVAPASRPPLADASFMTQVTKDSPKRPPTTRSATPCARNLFPAHSHTVSTSRVSLLPHHPLSQSRPLIVLDLDETLVHASIDHVPHDVAFNVDMGSQIIPVYVKIRPFAKEFLRRVSVLFEVAVFTASLAPYAEQVVKHLDPSQSMVHHCLFRQHCTNVEGSFIKDMSLLGRSLERIAIVDNSPVAYSFQPDNGIPIISWFDDRHDSELLRLLPMLEHFATCGNIYQTNAKFRSSSER